MKLIKKTNPYLDGIFLRATKSLFVMRCIILFLFIGTLHSFAALTYSQSAKLSLSLTNASLEEVLGAIESESLFYFTYNTKQVNTNRRVSIDASDRSIDEVLNELFEGQNISYTIKDKHIVLYKENSVSKEGNTNSSINQTKQIKGVITDALGSPVIGANIVVKGTTNQGNRTKIIL